MTVDFAFQIGQIVKFKAQYAILGRMEPTKGDWAKTMSGRRDTCGMVVERHAMECSGGIQKVYRIRLASGEGIYEKLFDLNEIELETFP